MVYNGKDITGKRFGLLVAIKPTRQRYRNSVVWECKCDCGNSVGVSVVRLNGGNVKSCGQCKKLVTKYYCEVNGEMLTISEISMKYNLPFSTIWWRVRKGWTGNKLIMPHYAPPMDLGFDEPISFAEIARRAGVTRECIRIRYNKGYRGEGLINPIKHKKKGRPNGKKQM